ncbi:rfaE bifunctional protein [Sulfurihydrogenibium sp. YO3AOP1]|uniref:D-glycero-beta-D-manno-heptose-7-phosphate kinase n=1 Tax=Sulfurihydrogenibium sp. (strain YO3AOP1) TaxID=436114 RepID=UPI0001726027|nr:D-glycero-beta-D-manno-heptose-7-phosphate kinase [Sulfurihydrogenibium sp. YO3AOP1]ACD67329.1 rfaE bifunctional protein [Sulfurihydrogenibium sp. YO3AOP1]
MITKERAVNLISKFPDITVGVIGDIILDKYLWGDVERISPEAPVPVVDVKKETVSLGGASNVANNIASLDAKAYMIGVVGDDENAKIIENLLKSKNINPILITDKSRPTIEKTRIIAISQQLLRIDREDRSKLSTEIEDKIINEIKNIKDEINVFIVSDYGKGIITQRIMDFIKSLNKPIFVDPKPSNYQLYKHTTILTPNKKEAYESIKADKNTDLEFVGRKIMSDLELNQLLITLGGEGMALFEGDKILRIPTKAKKVFDVTGAGDTVISVLALARLAGGTWEESASLANTAAGYVVGEIGTATVSRDILIDLIG